MLDIFDILVFDYLDFLISRIPEFKFKKIPLPTSITSTSDWTYTIPQSLVIGLLYNKNNYVYHLING